MLINLRNALMAGKRLPYDAEVEYLESTGTQYINLGKLAFAEFGVSLAPVGLATPHYTYAYLGWNNNGSRTTGIYSDAVGTLNIRNFANASIGATVSDWTSFHDISYNGGVATVDGTDYNITLSNSPTYDFCLFGLKKSEINIGLTKCRIAAFSAKNQDGDFIVDYIPVRKGTVGYLYDRVSGKLFGNAGTGDFVLGPDVVPVEYIESHGTEWIDTGVDIANSDDARFVTTCTITNTVANYSSTWVGSGVLSTGGLHYVLDHNGIRTGGGDASMAIPYNRGDIVTIDVYYDSQHRRTCKIGQSIYQGTAYNARTARLAILDYPAPTDITSHPRQAGNLFHVEVYKSGTIIRKFLPIRVATDATSWEGAMMDVLTRRIYRNAGTGAFGYGNDLKYPIPA